MKSKDLYVKIFNIILESEESTIDWKKDKILIRTLWWLLALVLSIGLYSLIISLVSAFSFVGPNLTLFYRVLVISTWFVMLFTLFIFTYRYYILVILNKNKIFISNIVFFYFSSLIIFSYIYFYIYRISPSLFIYNNPLDIPKELVGIKASKLIAHLEFMLFSGFHGIGGAYNKIQSNSLLISIISWIQSLYVLSLVILFISSFVNQNTGKAKNNKN